MSNEEQLSLWVQGKLRGLKEKAHVVRKFGVHRIVECCPDFSCCHPELLAPLRLRKEFQDMPKSRDRMLRGFLMALLTKSKIGAGKKVYITG